MECPYCGKEHPDQARFCPITGKSLESSTSSFVRCPKCGKNVPSENHYCLNCGQTLVSARDARHGNVQPGGSFRRNIFLIAGGIVFLIVLILVLITLNRGRQKVTPATLANESLTKTALNQQMEGSPLPQNIAISTHTQTLVLLPTRNDPTLSIPATNSSATTQPERKLCPGAPPIRIEIGDTARVVTSKVLARSNPVVGTNVQWYFFQGAELKIIDGPVCSNDVSFFKVQESSSNHIGWIAEAEADTKNYYIEPVGEQ
jgi:hypothetical protein